MMYETSFLFNNNIIVTIIGCFIIWHYTIKCYTNNKIQQSIYQACYYFMTVVIALIIIYNEYSILNNLDFCTSYDITSINGVGEFPLISYYYSIIIGWYIYSAIILLYEKYYFNTYQKDFWQMLLHHIIILPIIYIGCHLGFSFIGIWILLLHDVNDVLLHLAKIFKSTIFFLLFTFSFAICRFILLPQYVYNAYKNIEMCRQIDNYLFMVSIVIYILILLNIYWFYLILCIIYNVLQGKNLKDVRDNKDE